MIYACYTFAIESTVKFGFVKFKRAIFNAHFAAIFIFKPWERSNDYPLKHSLTFLTILITFQEMHWTKVILLLQFILYCWQLHSDVVPNSPPFLVKHLSTETCTDTRWSIIAFAMCSDFFDGMIVQSKLDRSYVTGF